jgi:hypothetical protein
MKIVATYQQSLVFTTNARYSNDFQIQRIFKKDQKNKFVIRFPNITANATSTFTTPIQLYMYHPELCKNVNTATLNSMGDLINNNKFLLATLFSSTSAIVNVRNDTFLLVDDIPLTPVNVNVEYSGTQLPPNNNAFYYITMLIYEVEGSLDAAVDFF